MLTRYATTSFHHKALHVVIELFPCLVRHVLMLVILLYCIYTTRLLLRRTLLRLFWRVR
jgi:hypothetical protein